MKTLKMLEMLLALSIITALVIPVFTIPVNAVKLNIPPEANDPIVWETRSGWGVDAYNTMFWNPEWLKLRVDTDVLTTTEIVVQGLDEYGANIEAKVYVPAGTGSQRIFNFTDVHSGEPVAFTKITGIYQQNGTHSDSFEIMTEPVHYEQYLGQYESSHGFWEPGRMDYNYPNLGVGQYLATSGRAVIGSTLPAPTIQDVPVEPFNPDPIKILINWIDYYGVLQPMYDTNNEWQFGGAKNASVITIEGLDETGAKLIVNVHINAGDMWVYVNSTNSDIGSHTFSTICKVWGGFKGDSYYILTHPMPERGLFEYYIRIHHLSLYPGSYDILANPAVDPLKPGAYPGVTTITVALKDIDDHLVYFGDSDNWYQGSVPQPIVINWWTSAGVIHPSYSEIHKGQVAITVNITADTNARTIKVVADANIPKHTNAGTAIMPAPEMNLLAWTEMTFDGINSVLDTSGWPIHILTAGYIDRFGNNVTFNAPTRPPLPEFLGGPTADSLTPPWKLDGPLYEVSIPLYPGCNLISSPVYPFMIGFNDAYYTSPWGGPGIPMDLLFGMTSATTTIEAIWWYDAGSTSWNTYIPGVTAAPSGMMFNDGVGYWIKAEKSCTLELSGVQMENAPFVPEEYTIYHSWNLIGFTSIIQMATADYLESLNTGYIGTGVSIVMQSAAGPIWVWDALHQSWSRDPALLWPGQGLWMNYKLAGTADLSP